MSEHRGGLALHGIERALVFNRLRAAVGLRWELPPLLHTLKLPPQSLCLEIGAGRGWGSVGLARQDGASTIIATDYDSTVLPLTRSYVQHTVPDARIAFAAASAKSFPFPGETFDLVLALYVLHHVAGYREAITQIARVLKPGGYFAFIDVIRPPGSPQMKTIVPPDGLISGTDLMRLLTAAGFVIENRRGTPIWTLIIARKR